MVIQNWLSHSDDSESGSDPASRIFGFDDFPSEDLQFSVGFSASFLEAVAGFSIAFVFMWKAFPWFSHDFRCFSMVFSMVFPWFKTMCSLHFLGFRQPSWTSPRQVAAPTGKPQPWLFSPSRGPKHPFGNCL